MRPQGRPYRPAAWHQSSHRLRGRPYGKLLPRYTGAIAAFLVKHPDASRAALLDFIEATFGVRVSRIALYKFLKRYGLDQIPTPATPDSPPLTAPAPQPQPVAAPTTTTFVPAGIAAPLPAPPFSSHARSTPEPSC